MPSTFIFGDVNLIIFSKSYGKSHSCERPTIDFLYPKNATISVALGINVTIFFTYQFFSFLFRLHKIS